MQLKINFVQFSKQNVCTNQQNNRLIYTRNEPVSFDLAGPPSLLSHRTGGTGFLLL